jgi:hypothetical protein
MLILLQTNPQVKFQKGVPLIFASVLNHCQNSCGFDRFEESLVDVVGLRGKHA